MGISFRLHLNTCEYQSDFIWIHPNTTKASPEYMWISLRLIWIHVNITQTSSEYTWTSLRLHLNTCEHHSGFIWIHVNHEYHSGITWIHENITQAHLNTCEFHSDFIWIHVNITQASSEYMWISLRCHLNSSQYHSGLGQTWSCNRLHVSSQCNQVKNPSVHEPLCFPETNPVCCLT